MLADFGITAEIELKSDASAAISIASRTGLGKVRHIEVCQLWLQDKVKQGKITVQKVTTNENVADTMTKHVPRDTLAKHLVETGQTVSNDRHELAPKVKQE